MVLRLALTVALAATVLAGPRAAASEAKPVKAAYASVVVGKSVQGRPIVAWHLGETKAEGRADRRHARQRAGADRDPAHLRDGKSVHGIDLWVVPAYNPDGLAHSSRRNAHGVDLNRNYPYHWAPLDGVYYSGPKPASEPETRAMMGFLAQVRPDYVLSFHQPLHGVDVAVERPTFARRVARLLGLPATTLDCGGVCHGTMTGWYNHRHPGFALTVEYGAGRRRLMTQVAPGQVLRIFGAWRGRTWTVPTCRASGVSGAATSRPSLLRSVAGGASAHGSWAGSLAPSTEDAMPADVDADDSAPLEDRLLLVHEGVDGGGVVGGGAGQRHHRGLERDRLLEGVAGGEADRAPHGAVARRSGRRPGRPRARRPRPRGRRPGPRAWPGPARAPRRP